MSLRGVKHSPKIMIPFSLNQLTSFIRRTPDILEAQLSNLPNEWLHVKEGPETWSVYDVVGHLIHGEKTDWIGRANRILEFGEDKPFDPFDRTAMQREPQDLPIQELLSRFQQLRYANIQSLEELHISEDHLDKTGRHPALGVVTLRELLTTWAVHDLSHLNQINRVLAHQWSDSTGPWKAYLGILNHSNASS